MQERPGQSGSDTKIAAEHNSAAGSVLTEDQALELIAFLTTSAEISLKEPVHYGTLRLVDGASRLIGFMLENGTPDPDGFLRRLKGDIDTKKLWSMWDKPSYFHFLRETPAQVAGEIADRSAAITMSTEGGTHE